MHAPGSLYIARPLGGHFDSLNTIMFLGKEPGGGYIEATWIAGKGPSFHEIATYEASCTGGDYPPDDYKVKRVRISRLGNRRLLYVHKWLATEIQYPTVEEWNCPIVGVQFYKAKLKLEKEIKRRKLTHRMYHEETQG